MGVGERFRQPGRLSYGAWVQKVDVGGVLVKLRLLEVNGHRTGNLGFMPYGVKDSTTLKDFA